MVRYYNNTDCTDFDLQASLDFQRIEHTNPGYQIVCLPVLTKKGEEVGVSLITLRIAQHGLSRESSMQDAYFA